MSDEKSKKSNVHFSSEEPRSVEEIGRFLVSVGEKMLAQGGFTVVQGGQEFYIEPAGATKLELQYKTKGEKQQFEIEIEWKPSAGGAGEVEIK